MGRTHRSIASRAPQPGVFTDHALKRRGDERELVVDCDRVYELNGEDSSTLIDELTPGFSLGQQFSRPLPNGRAGEVRALITSGGFDRRPEAYREMS